MIGCGWQHRKDSHGFGRRIEPVRLRFVPLGIVVTLSLLVIVIALTATVRSFAAPSGHPGLAAGPCRRQRWPNLTSGAGAGARALPEKGGARRGQEPLLLRHGCDTSRRSRQWRAGAPVLRRLRSQPVVSRHLVGSWRRQQSERHGRFFKRQAVLEELRQCHGFWN